jgi:hypothetical protein
VSMATVPNTPAMAPWTSVRITLMRPIDTKLADALFSQRLGMAPNCGYGPAPPAGARQASSSSFSSHMSTEARAPGVSEASIALNA